MSSSVYPVPDESVAYVYDGTLEGLLCAIFETYVRKEVPLDVVTSEHLQLRLGQEVYEVTTDATLAKRVRAGLVKTCGAEVYDAVRVASVSDEPQAGSIICTFVRYSMQWQGNTLNQLANPEVQPFIALHTSVVNERHYMVQFLRFQELEGGVWFAKGNPKANVVPLIMDWFVARFNTQPFIIYDEVHEVAGVYEGRGWFLVKGNELNLPGVSANEVEMAGAWKRFYEAVCVEARYNPELRRQFMPKRLWNNIVEVAGSTPDTHPARR